MSEGKKPGREPTERALLVHEAEQRQCDRLNAMVIESTDRNRDLVSAYVVTRATLIMNGYDDMLALLDARAAYIVKHWHETGYAVVALPAEPSDTKPS